MVKIFVNEKEYKVREKTTLAELRERLKPAADIFIVNGFPADLNCVLSQGDRVIFIQKGEIPKAEELETLMAARHSPGVLKIMKKATVGIAGLGGLGSSVAVALARMGTGTLILVDYDIVEPSNLNRQHFFIDQIGMPKTEAIAQSLSRIYPSIQTIAYQERIREANILSFFGKADVVVECFDRAEEKKMILEAAGAILPETFIIGSSGVAGYGDSNAIKTWRLSEKIFLVGDLENAAGPGSGLMAPRVGIAAHHQANLAVALLMEPESEIKTIPGIPVK